MRQLTLATGTFETHRKPTRREKFLADMEKVVPWPLALTRMNPPLLT